MKIEEWKIKGSYARRPKCGKGRDPAVTYLNACLAGTKDAKIRGHGTVHVSEIGAKTGGPGRAHGPQVPDCPLSLASRDGPGKFTVIYNKQQFFIFDIYT
jgi:hypothetical protein